MRGVVLGGALGFGVPNLWVAWRAPHNWLEIWRFHLRRDPDFETPWAGLADLGRDRWPAFDWGEGYRSLVGTTGTILLLVLTLALAWGQRRGRVDALAAGALFTIAFLLLNRVYSPQYTLWVLPLLVVLQAPWLPLLGFTAADAANYWVRYRLFTPPEGATMGWNEAWQPWSNLFVLVRWGFLAWCAAAIFARAWRVGSAARAESSGSLRAPAGP